SWSPRGDTAFDTQVHGCWSRGVPAASIRALALIASLALVSKSAPAPPSLDVKGIHGAERCEPCTDPPLQAHRVREDTWIFRQSKCVHFEAPFLYFLLGEKRALLLDTGATESEEKLPLRAAVRERIDAWCKSKKLESIDLVVAHSHSHGDHVAGDGQFRS